MPEWFLIICAVAAVVSAIVLLYIHTDWDDHDDIDRESGDW